MDLDKDRLAKLLSMTGSDHDAEALAAVRKANEFLRQHRKSWADVLGTSTPPIEPPPAQPRQAASPEPPRLRPGYRRLHDYRNALRREPFLPRLLGFPFWLIVELLAFLFPNSQINTRGGIIALVFALGMLSGIAGWAWLGYYLLF